MINPCRTEDEKRAQLIRADKKRRNRPERILYLKCYSLTKKLEKMNKMLQECKDILHPENELKEENIQTELI